MVEEHSRRKIDARRSSLLGLDPRTGRGPARHREGSLFWPLGHVTLARRDFLMAMNAAFIGAIAAACSCDPQLPELPLSVEGLQGWISTTKGRFLFGDGTATPGHGKAVHEARDVRSGQALFSQATAGLRPTWDTTIFDVPCIRSDGTRYLTRSSALAAPGLVIVGCAFDSGSTGFRALTGARSTQTPGGDPAEDAWTLNTSSSDQMRALVATDTEVAFADTPAILGRSCWSCWRRSGTSCECGK
jgi:hypothetical protein